MSTTVTGIVFCLAIMVICGIAGYLNMPVNVAEISVAVHDPGNVRRGLYRLPGGSYEVIQVLGNRSETDSTLLFTHHYELFLVKCGNADETGYLVVQTEKNKRALEQRKTPAMTGRVSYYHSDSESGSEYQNVLLLTDMGSLIRLWGESIFFYIVDIVFLFLLVRTIRRAAA